MILTKKQEEGLKIAVERYKNREPYTCIAGYAGTGKSTLVHFIVEALGIDPDRVCYIAFTGKAALVLKEKGCRNSMTAHKLLYKSFQNPDGTFRHIPRLEIGPFKLIVVDEISMLPKPIWDLLLSHRIPVIALGDPGQLPPIGDDNKVLEHPHVFLDEIMRQAQESEIIRLTMDIREGKPLSLFKGNEVQILPQSALSSGMLMWADKILVGKNLTRNQLNNAIRKDLWDTDNREPVIGDKMICLKNYWNFANGSDDVLVNGLCGSITKLNTITNPYSIYKDTYIGFLPEYYDDNNPDDLFRNVHIDSKLLIKGEPTVNASNFKKFPKNRRPYEFDYGYCITCHKSQGSEYNKVLVLEEYLKGNEHERWLYTAATRAKDKLVIIKDYHN